MKKVDHIGIAVKNIDESVDYYIHTLGLTYWQLKKLKVRKYALHSLMPGILSWNYWNQ